VYAVSTLVCGLIHKSDLLELMQHNADFKNRLMQKVNSYSDSHIKFLTLMLKNVGAFRGVPLHIIKNLIYKLRERRVKSKGIVLNVGEVSEECYFI
jgi:hypothetical protein